MFIDSKTLETALYSLRGTAGHLLKIWLVLKHMGLEEGGESIRIDTGNTTDSLTRLFSYGSPENSFFIPFAHTSRYLRMKHDASRSIIQTNIRRWASSGSVVTCDPTGYLDLSSEPDNSILVQAGRRYPFGLGHGESGFALKEDERVCLPIRAFSVWYGRKTNIPEGEDPAEYLIERVLTELHISESERELIFVQDNITIETQKDPLRDETIYDLCVNQVTSDPPSKSEFQQQTFADYSKTVHSLMSNLDQPTWMRSSPEEELNELIAQGAKAILLSGPPRTGKTRAIDRIIDRDSSDRCTIQMHDGWGYDNLIEGLRPNVDQSWNWTSGPLKKAIEEGKSTIVLEEINRTEISQALGEVFSLIEDGYRGEHYAIELRSGQPFYIPDNVVFLLTMNTIDKSTEEVDDALIGRLAVVTFPPRSEDLSSMLNNQSVPDPTKKNLLLLFTEILSVYPLGHGYFSGIKGDVSNKDVILYYKTRIRPVLANFLGELKAADLQQIDNHVDDLFGKHES